MTDSNNSGDDLFESLRKQVPPEKLEAQQKELAEKQAAQNLKAQQRLAYLIGDNSTLPTTINSVNLIGVKNTRRSFLDPLIKPLLSANQDKPYTLTEALNKIGAVSDKLKRFDIFHEPVSAFIDRPDPTDPNSSPNDLNVYITARERGRISLKTGTDLGNVEGSAYGNLTWRNILGGAESLNLNASAGTRTRSAYQATFDAPILSDPDKRITVDALASSTHKPFASHEEGLRGAGVKYNWIAEGGARHQVGYSGTWRQITSLAGNASPTVRNDAGDSVKSAISHTWLSDKRNHPFLPSSGYMLKSVSEIAGWGPLQGDVAFWKSELETAGAVAVPIPGVKGDSGVTFTSSLRAGMLYPLPVGFGTSSKPSRINDRFQLGGPTDVRGFKISGLGPRDGVDAVGGDIYAAGSLGLLMPFPRVGKDTPLRLQLFANAGRLLALKDAGADSKSTQKNVYSTLGQLADGSLPSLAVGLGVVYAHPVARFELNFALPLVVRRGEEGRKGLQFGVGINFM